ncbi:MAG: DUF1780 family protein [Pseudomonadota bacterium]|nr:MAG: hypothetical protein DWQ08_01360 [Pseudomonadota bacterium]QKK01293.1 MAG: DUF1780 family protein [Pseudomonadota bacterium]
MNDIENMPEWRAERVRSLEESVKFWSDENKFHRECHVVMTLLLSLGEQFEVSELLPAEEPIDVRIRDYNFQIKEVMQSGRKRHDEYVKALEKAKRAKRYSDLLTEYTPKKVTLEEIVERCVKRSINLTKKYGPRERENLDLVCYFNYIENEEVYSAIDLPSEHYYRDSSRFCVG